MEITGYENPIIVGFGGKLVCSTQLQVTALHWFLDGIDIPVKTTTEQQLRFTLNPDDITLNGAIFICEVHTESNVYRRNASITVKGTLCSLMIVPFIMFQQCSKCLDLVVHCHLYYLYRNAARGHNHHRE